LEMLLAQSRELSLILENLENVFRARWINNLRVKVRSVKKWGLRLITKLAIFLWIFPAHSILPRNLPGPQDER
jgi:hypothetical protein